MVLFRIENIKKVVLGYNHTLKVDFVFSFSSLETQTRNLVHLSSFADFDHVPGVFERSNHEIQYQRIEKPTKRR
jgi:hypothetical protein